MLGRLEAIPWFFSRQKLYLMFVLLCFVMANIIHWIIPYWALYCPGGRACDTCLLPMVKHLGRCKKNKRQTLCQRMSKDGERGRKLFEMWLGSKCYEYLGTHFLWTLKGAVHPKMGAKVGTLVQRRFCGAVLAQVLVLYIATEENSLWGLDYLSFAFFRYRHC